MQQIAKQIAKNATFQAFMNCYIREVRSGHWVKKEEWIKEQRLSALITEAYILELELPRQNIRFAFGVEYKSLVGRQVFGASLKYCTKQKQWLVEDKLTILITLIQELHCTTKMDGCLKLSSHFDELILRIIESYQTMAHYIEKSFEGDKQHRASDTFIEAEQSLLLGHWLHPTPKSRQGMADWQQTSFAPELQGSFQLHYFRVDRKMVNEASVLEISASEHIARSLIKSQPEFVKSENVCYIPVHPLQAQWLLQQQYVKKAIAEDLIKYEGALGAYYTATSSIRTVYNAQEEMMYKFSIPVKITNSLRVNRTHELKAGIAMARLMKKIDFLQKHSSFQMMNDPAYMTIKFPNQTESGFEVIFRSNIFPKGHDEGICMIATLVQEPLLEEKSKLCQLIMKIAQSEFRSLESVSLDWFKVYWTNAIEPLLRLYDEHGIALEAHQQNSLLNISSGYPTKYYYRDNQGYYLSKAYKDVLLSIEPSLHETEELFYEDALIHDRFTYYLFMNQLFPVIARFGADQLINENELLKWSMDQLHLLEKEFTGFGKIFVRNILKQEELAFKANLLTRFHDVDELEAELEQAVYTKIPNPFVIQFEEAEYAAATAFS
ncbi:siderophore biosynthesis protein [Lysinibacillus sphaericus]|uniref:Rhizobactin siderophore biosynthesis protein n=4 Tax=Lysinibacillus TaxID=400634 RepID=B1HNI2_LYSSC|nr:MULTISPECIES: IucA/IucC family protein [Lysinibacillus]MBE5083474.1 siderophore biosynthesis protein [Bacillus thuringiensis]ACA40492.1 Rhizobactin siderophore biosynthesis protein [Lysinibacillus sphaericus C3-41]AMO33498.1 siderophore biosynthesis protein [Lysinibacillus sphaericus]AMR91396.1 siderophore biosynthesis protein [Lysinibacillus sphaericus]ANA45444.1 siderophore biosynthesis protein [Lysinibacillus sphaericus]